MTVLNVLTYYRWSITLVMAKCLSDQRTLKDLHERRTRWYKILLLQCVKQDSVSYVVVCYVILPQHKIKNNKADWFVCDSRPRALLRPVTCGKTGRRRVSGFSFLRVNCKTNTVQLEDARGRVQSSAGSYLYQMCPYAIRLHKFCESEYGIYVLICVHVLERILW